MSPARTLGRLLLRSGTALGRALLLGNNTPLYPIPTTNLFLWSKAEDLQNQGIADGGSVNNWRDLTPNSTIVASQGTAGNRPTLVYNQLNGYPVVRFDGASDFLTYNNVSHAQPMTYFIVAIVTAGQSGNRSIIASGSGTQNSMFVMGGSSDHIGIFDGAAIQQTANPFSAAWHLFEHTAKADPDLLSIDGTQVISAASGADDSGVIRLGANSTAPGSLTSCCAMDVAEVIVYAEDCAAATRTAVRTYLANKYAISGVVPFSLRFFLESLRTPTSRLATPRRSLTMSPA